MMIFAIVAVDLFRDFGQNATYRTIQRYGAADGTWGKGAGMKWSPSAPFVETTTAVTAMTLRGYHYGQEYFGSFFRSLFTLFQVLTGESWSEAVVRPLLFGWDADSALVPGLFFTFYILLTALVLQNVVVAVLLDKFSGEEEEEEDDDEDEEGEEEDEIERSNMGSPNLPVAVAQTPHRELRGRAPWDSSSPAGVSTGSYANGGTQLSAADVAMLQAAEECGGRFPPPTPGRRSSTGPLRGADLIQLRSDVDKLLDGEAVIRAHLHVILARLSELPPVSTEGPVAGAKSERGAPSKSPGKS